MEIKLLHLTDLHLAVRKNFINVRDVLYKKYWMDRAMGRKPQTCLTDIFAPSTYDEQVAESLSLFVWQRMADIDAVIISGDISTTGMQEDVEAAKSFLTEPSCYDNSNVINPASASPATMGFASPKLQILPGNHERYVSLPSLPSFTYFPELGLGHFENVFAGIGRWRKGVAVQGALVGDALGVIRVDFSVTDNLVFRNKVSAWGRGYVKDDTLCQLCDLTEKMYDLGYPAIWVTHFPPNVPQPRKRSLMLERESELIRAAQVKGVKLILSGHYHEPRDYCVSGVRVVISASSTSTDSIQGCSQIKINASRYNLDPEIEVEPYKFDVGQCAFISSLIPDDHKESC